MIEAEFREKYRDEKHLYQAWGQYVKEVIVNALQEKGESYGILKLPVSPRVKEEDSIVAKAFYRGKKYKDPYNEITDKVGIRFVVLTTEKIEVIKEIIEHIDIWSYSEDVDYSRNIEEKPELFTYQSVHYIVRLKSELVINSITLPLEIPCEIQIRTLLQHAYAELSHDTVYKKETEISPYIKRLLARSMALIETTDSLFKEVYDVLQKENSKYTEFNKLAEKYMCFNNYTESLNNFIFSNYQSFLDDNIFSIGDIDNFMLSRMYLQDKIREKEQFNILYRQPIIFFLFYLIKNYKYQMLEKWPMDVSMLEPVFTDIGEAWDI